MESQAQVAVPTRVEFEFSGDETIMPPVEGVPMTLFVEGDKIGVVDDAGNRWRVPAKDVREVLRRVG
jgi:hypothetical protein